MATQTRGKDLSGKLDKLRERIGKVDVSTGDKRFWRPEKGRNTVRILPPVGEMEVFWQEVGQHFLPDKQMAYCPEFTTVADEDTDPPFECPICELVRELRKGSAADQALAAKIKVTKRFWMNVIVRKWITNPKPGVTQEERAEGPFILAAGPQIFAQIQALVGNPDYGDVSDPEEGAGVDLDIDKQGEGIDTEYKVNVRRGEHPLHSDQAVIDKWLEAAQDLSWVELTGDEAEDKELQAKYVVCLLDYEAMVEKFGLEPGVDVSGILPAEAEPVRASTRKRGEAKEGKLPVEEGEVGAELRKRRAARRPRG